MRIHSLPSFGAPVTTTPIVDDEQMGAGIAGYCSFKGAGSAAEDVYERQVGSMHVRICTRDILGGAVGENFGHGKHCIEVCLAGLWYRQARNLL